jgi:microcystin degradation protein MlrC
VGTAGDGVLVANHGAGVSEEFPDMEGAFVSSVRAIVGPGAVVAACLDMHANISEQFIGAVDICCVWRTTPHVDTRARSVKTATLLHRAMEGEIKPVCHRH